MFPQKGYTLTELVIVTAIIGILTSAVFNNFRYQRQYVNYNDTLTDVVSVIKTARSYAATSRAVYDSSKPAGQEIYIPKEGYGIYIERNATPGTSRLILFANTSDSSSTDAQLHYDNDGVAPDDIVEEIYTIHKDVVFESLDGIDLNPANSTPVNRATILFRPPLAEVTLSENTDPADTPPPPFGVPTNYDTLNIVLSRVDAPAGVPDSVITINKTAGFPELVLE